MQCTPHMLPRARRVPMLALLLCLLLFPYQCDSFTEVFSIAKDSDDHTYIVGNRDSNFFIEKKSASCESQWESTAGSTSGDDDNDVNAEVLYDATIGNGVVYAVGSTKGNFSSPTEKAPNLDAVVLVYDQTNGDAVRQKQYDIAAELNNIAQAVVQKADGNLLVAVYGSASNVETSVIYETRILEIDSQTLEVQSIHEIDVSTTEQLFSVAGGPKLLDFIYEESSDSIIALGHILGRGIILKHSLATDTITSQVEWGQALGNFQISGFVSDGNGVYFVVGSSSERVLENTDLQSTVSSEFHAYVIRYDNLDSSSSSATWVRQLAGTGSSQSGNGITIDPVTGDIVVVGDFDADFTVSDSQTSATFAVDSAADNGITDVFLWYLDPSTGDFKDLRSSTVASTASEDRGNVVSVLSTRTVQIGGITNDGNDAGAAICDTTNTFPTTTASSFPTASRTPSSTPPATASPTSTTSPSSSKISTATPTASQSTVPFSTETPSTSSHSLPPTPSNSPSITEADLGASPTQSFSETEPDSSSTQLSPLVANPSVTSISSSEETISPFDSENTQPSQGPSFEVMVSSSPTVDIPHLESGTSPSGDPLVFKSATPSPSSEALQSAFLSSPTVTQDFIIEGEPSPTFPFVAASREATLTLNPSVSVSFTFVDLGTPTPSSTFGSGGSPTPTFDPSMSVLFTFVDLGSPTPSSTPGSEGSHTPSPSSLMSAVEVNFISPTPSPGRISPTLVLGTMTPDSSEDSPESPQSTEVLEGLNTAEPDDGRDAASIVDSQPSASSTEDGLGILPDVPEASIPFSGDVTASMAAEQSPTAFDAPVEPTSLPPHPISVNEDEPQESSSTLPSLIEASTTEKFTPESLHESGEMFGNDLIPSPPDLIESPSMLLASPEASQPPVDPEEISPFPSTNLPNANFLTDTPKDAETEQIQSPTNALNPSEAFISDTTFLDPEESMGPDTIVSEPPSASLLFPHAADSEIKDPEDSPEASGEFNHLPQPSLLSLLSPSEAPREAKLGGSPSTDGFTSQTGNLKATPFALQTPEQSDVEDASPLRTDETEETNPLQSESSMSAPIFSDDFDDKEQNPHPGGISFDLLDASDSAVPPEPSVEVFKLHPTPFMSMEVEIEEPGPSLTPSDESDTKDPIEENGIATAFPMEELSSTSPEPSLEDMIEPLISSEPSLLTSASPSVLNFDVGLFTQAAVNDGGSTMESTPEELFVDLLPTASTSFAIGSPTEDPAEKGEQQDFTAFSTIFPSPMSATQENSNEVSETSSGIGVATPTPSIMESAPFSMSVPAASMAPMLSDSPASPTSVPMDVPEISSEPSISFKEVVLDSETPFLSPTFSEETIHVTPAVATSSLGSAAPGVSSPSATNRPSEAPSVVFPSTTPSTSSGVSRTVEPSSTAVNLRQSVSPFPTSSLIVSSTPGDASNQPSSSILPSISVQINAPSTSPTPFGKELTSFSPSSQVSGNPSVSTEAVPVVSRGVNFSKSPSPTVSASPSRAILITSRPSPSETSTILPSISPGPTFSGSPTFLPSISSGTASLVTPAFSPSMSMLSVSPGTASFTPSETSLPSSPEVSTFEPTVSSLPTGKLSITPVISPTYTEEPTPSFALNFSPTYAFDPTPMVTLAISPTDTDDPTPTTTPLISPPYTDEPTPIITSVFSPTYTYEPTPMITPVISPIFTDEPTPTITPEFSPTYTDDPTPSLTPEISPTFTFEPSPLMSPSTSPSASSLRPTASSTSPTPGISSSASPSSIAFPTGSCEPNGDVLTYPDSLNRTRNFQRVNLVIQVAGPRLTSSCEFTATIADRFTLLSAVNTLSQADMWYITSIEDGPAVIEEDSNLVAIEQERITENEIGRSSPSPSQDGGKRIRFPGSVIFNVTAFMNPLSVELASGPYVEYIDSQNIVKVMTAEGFDDIKWTGMVVAPVVLDARSVEEDSRTSAGGLSSGEISAFAIGGLLIAGVVGFVIAESGVSIRESGPVLPV